MAVHHRLGFRHCLVDFQVQQNFAGARPSARQLLAFQVHQAQVLGLQVALTDQRGAADHLVRPYPVGDIPAVAVHVLPHPELPSDGANLFLDGWASGDVKSAIREGSSPATVPLAWGRPRCAAGTRRDAPRSQGLFRRRCQNRAVGATADFGGGFPGSGFDVASVMTLNDVRSIVFILVQYLITLPALRRRRDDPALPRESQRRGDAFAGGCGDAMA